ncbi:MAG: aldehyde ferredoxin oxidoreductase family protein [Thermoleophilia bacterium]
MGITAYVDLTRRTVDVTETPPKATRAFLGGRGLNVATLLALLPPDADPLGPENVLVFGTGLLTGYPVPNSGRMNISARSPETGILGDANMGGFFPTHLRRSGLDRIVVTGSAEEPVLLYAEAGKVEIRPAKAYWGLDVPQTQEAIEQDYGTHVRSAVIGPAGENLVRFACVMNARKNAAGRSGMGAVMGSKHLKAVVAAGDGRPPVHDRDSLLALRKELNTRLHESKIIEVLGKVGTPLLYENSNRLGAIRTKNSQLNQWSSALDARHIEEHALKMVSCAGCTVHCRHVNRFGGEGPDFSTQALLGANLGIDDPVAVITLGNLCNDLGLDTSSAGGVIGWAMELYQRGIIGDEQTGGPLLWGDVDRVRELLLDTASRRGFGDVVAESSQAVRLGKLPPEANRYFMGIKNLPQSDPHDVRYLKAFALGVAISSRGADHLRSRPTLEILALPDRVRETVYGEPTLAEMTEYETKEVVVSWSETMFAMIDSVGICKFVCRGFNSPHLLGYEEVSRMIEPALGLRLSPEELEEAGRRVVDAERLLNARFGLTRADDTLPARTFDEPMPLGLAKGHHIDREAFDRLLTRYYLRRGWDDQGRVSNERRDEIEGLAARLAAWAPATGAGRI